MLGIKYLLVVGCISFCSSGLAYAQSAAQWDAMRIYFEQQYLEKVVTEAYSPITIKQLEEDLAAVQAKRLAMPQVQRGVVKATYICALQGNRLVSEQSEWQMRGAWQQLDADYADLGNISFSPMRARSQKDGQRQLVDIDRYLPTGELVVPDDPAYPEIVFGFTLNEVRRGSKQFDVRVPSASIAEMYVAVPAGMEVTSTQATAEKIEASDVPVALEVNDYSGLGKEGSEWWLVTCSGLTTFELAVEQRNASAEGVAQLLVSKGNIEYQIDASNVRVTAAYEVAPSASDLPIRLSVDPGAKLLDVDVDGIAVDWHALLVNANRKDGEEGLAADKGLNETNLSNADSQPILVELGKTLRECSGKIITIRGLVAHSAEQAFRLPVVQLDGAYCVSGEVRIESKRGILLSQVMLGGKPVPARFDDSSQQRLISWMGQPPSLTTEVAFVSDIWEVESLTRFSIQPARLTATCRARVNIAEAKTNLLTFRVERNWLVDSVRIVGDAASRLRTNLRQATQTQRWFVDVSWDDNPVNLQFDIEITAHDPRNRRVERLNLRPRSLLTLPEAQQDDHFVIEPSGQYRLDVTRSLLAQQVQPVDLPAWQRDELVESGEAWVFAQRQGTVPSIKLLAYRGSFVANIVSVAKRAAFDTVKGDAESAGRQNQEASGWVVISNIECRPISGAVTSVSCVLPASINPQDIQWSLLESELDSSLLSVDSAARSSEDARIVTLELPAPTSQPFTLQARIEASVSGAEVELPVVAVPGAIGGSSTILLPPELTLTSSTAGVQVLLDVKGFSEARYDGLLADQTAKQRGEFVAARVDAAASHLLSATAVMDSKRNAVWIQQQTVEHRALAGRELQHTVRWTAESGVDGSLVVRLPDQWQLRSLSLDGEVLDTSAAGFQQLQIVLPANATSEVDATFVSPASGRGWMQWLDLEQPLVDAPVVSTRRIVKIPPSMTTYSLWSQAGRGDTLMDRIVPRQLWRILAPRSQGETVAAWTTLELPPAQRQGAENREADERRGKNAMATLGTDVVLFSRTALAAFSTALILLLIGLLRYLMPHSLAYWFGVVLAVMAMVLLVPVPLLPVAQLVLLSACCAMILRLMYPVFNYRNGSEVLSSGPRSRSIRSMPGVVLMLLVPTSFAQAQLIEQEATEQAGVKTYGLLIPTTETDDGFEVAGSYAYIPKELLELLRQDDDAGQTSSQPYIVAADYQLRLRRNTLTGVTRATDFRLDLDVEFPLATSELVLPFLDPQIVLTGAQINGQSVAPGGRVIQEPGRIVVSPGTVGEIDIQLQFSELTPSDSQGKNTLKVSIPPLPVATLRIVTDGQQDFEIASIGPIQRSMASTLARIGQLNALHVSWVDSGQVEDVPPRPLQLRAQTWLHADASNLVAASRLSLSGTLPASGEISVVVDAGWVPVGDQWGDAIVLDSSLVAYGRQVSFRLRCSSQSGDPNRCEIRCLLVPRNLERAVTLRAPFLTLQGSSQPERAFLWSADAQARWRPEDLAFWQPSDPAEFAPWNALAFDGSDPVAFTATPEAGTPAARRQAAAKPLEVFAREETQLHLDESVSHLDYTAQFDVPWEQGQFRLQIPETCIVSGVQIDEVDVESFSVGEQQNGRVLIVDSPATSVTTLTVQANLRTRSGVLTKMPRVTLSGVSVSSSRYYVFRGGGLDCEIESIPELPFAPFDVPSSQLLQQLESTVAAVELQGNYRDVRELPSAFRVRNKTSESNLQTLQKIVRTEQGWQETLYCVWSDVQSPLDIVCLEVPARLRDEIDLGPLSRRYVPTGDPDTLTLCVLPPPPENSRVMIAMRFPVATASSNQTLGLEKIKVLDQDEVVSYIALPSEFTVPGSSEPLPVRWTKVGSEVSSSGFSNMLGQGPWKVFRTLGRQTQASWLARGTAKSGRLLRQQIEFTNLDSNGITALMSYWIDPAGQASFSAMIPEGCELLGVRSGGRILDWHFSKAGKEIGQGASMKEARILLQPNYLPTHLSMLLKYDTETAEAMGVALPEVQMQGIGSRIDVVNHLAGYTVETVGEEIANGRLSGNAGAGGRESGGEYEQQWADILADALPTLSGLAEDEVAQWLQSWHPRSVGVLPDASVQASGLLSADEASSGEVSALAYWRAIGEELGSSLANDFAGVASGRPELLSSQELTHASGNTLKLRKVVGQTNSISRVGAASALLLILALVLVLRMRIGATYKAILAHNPWLYWLQLAAVLLVVLPVIWPAAFICVLATISAVSQWLDQWKRRRAGIQPR